MNNEAIGKALAHVLKESKGYFHTQEEREKYLVGAVEALSVALLSEPKTVGITYPHCAPPFGPI